MPKDAPSPAPPAPSSPSPLTGPTVASAADEQRTEPVDDNASSKSNNSDHCDGPTQPLPLQFGNLLDCKPRPMGVTIASAFDGECLRDNDGTHLDYEAPNAAKVHHDWHNDCLSKMR